MSVSIKLEPVNKQCSFVPLAVFGYCLGQSQQLTKPMSRVEVPIKTRVHSPTEKLQDILVAILAGCRTLAQVNTRLLPERALAQAWNRPVFAEQSTLSRLLDALKTAHLEQLRAANLALLKQHSQLHGHDWSKMLIMDIDPTSLLTSKRAEGSRKGWVSGKRNQHCRHILRFTLAGYHESIFSIAYPGDRHGFEYCIPAIKQLLTEWTWTKSQRKQIIIRSDAEQGTNKNVSYLLWLGFQLLIKGFSGPRTQAWVKRVEKEQWICDPERERWMAEAPARLRLGRRLNAYLLRWFGKKRKLKHATLLTTLPYNMFDLWSLYDQRAVTEIEIRSDKSGLALHQRRKKSLNAQEGWIVLTDIAHNLLAWLQPWMLAGSSFENFGPLRIVRDLLTIPGSVCIQNGKLQRVTLWETHPYAKEMANCLHKLLKTFNIA